MPADAEPANSNMPARAKARRGPRGKAEMALLHAAKYDVRQRLTKRSWWLKFLAWVSFGTTLVLLFLGGYLVLVADAQSRSQSLEDAKTLEAQRQTVADAQLILKGLPPMSCRRAQRETVLRSRSKPIERG